jgi:CheY-like chemotaxis protein
LDFSKIEGGMLELNLAPYDVGSLLNDVINIITVYVADKPVDFITEIAPDIPGTLIGDEKMCRQILVNILSNAVKYTQKGFVKFSASSRRFNDNEVQLTFAVADSGIGIKSGDMDKLFGDFIRIDQKRNIGIEGTGLGLSIARNLCLAMDGDLTAESEYGAGSKFTAVIIQQCRDFAPLIHVTTDPLRETMTVRFTAPEAKILIVDDISSNLKVAEGLLSYYKMEVHSCLNGEKAIELVQNNDYDLVLMDHMMPGLDGLESAARIRALPAARFRFLPIIMLTANAVSGMREMFLENGLDDFLAKPIEIAKLNELMEKWIPQRKKIKLSGEQNIPGPEETDLEIKGLNTSLGLKSIGGSLNKYLAVLEIYHKDALDRLLFLRPLAEKFDPQNLTNFVIQVHALKSASASIGATEISQKAALLENYGRLGDIALIAENLDLFCQKLTALAEEINMTLNKKEPSQDLSGSLA